MLMWFSLDLIPPLINKCIVTVVLPWPESTPNTQMYTVNVVLPWPESTSNTQMYTVNVVLPWPESRPSTQMYRVNVVLPYTQINVILTLPDTTPNTNYQGFTCTMCYYYIYEPTIVRIIE